MFSAEGGQHKKSALVFKDCSFEVPKKKILRGISGVARSGEVFAIMGPSGAGKTMLLNLLTLEDGPGNVSGEVELNGVPLTRALFEKHCAVVTQDDRHWAFLTARESIALACDFYQSGLDAAAKTERVSAVLKRVGLEECADTKVGNQFFAGLSGGQKRRLSLAVALMKQPSLVFLDEPTSGLDAAAAASIMSWLKELAHELNIVVLCTIHQPSSKVYNGFDGCMVLSNGRVAYNGAADSMAKYLSAAGCPTPEGSSVAEHVLDLVNREFSDKDSVDRLLDAWPASESEYSLTPDPEMSALEKKNRFGAGFFSQVASLLKRHALITLRDPSLYLGRFAVFLFTNAFFSIIYINTRERVQEQALYKIFLIMWHIGVPTSLGVVAVYMYNMEYFAIKSEIKDGMYSPGAYLVANTILQVPLMFILGIGALAVGAYGIAGYYGPNFGEFLVVYTATLWAFECMAQFFSIMFANPLLGMLNFMNMWFSSFLFAGVMVPEEDVIWPFRAFTYMLPLRWALTSMALVDFRDTTFGGAVPDDSPKGFSCPEMSDSSRATCYGYAGVDVLETIGETYKSITSKNTVARDVAIIVLIALVFKLQYIALLFIKTKASRAPSSAKSARS